MGFRRQQKHARQRTGLLRLGFWLMLPLVAFGVHTMLSIPLWLVELFFGLHLRPSGFFWTNIGMAFFLMLGGWWLESSNLHQGGGIALAKRMGARKAQGEHSQKERTYINVVEELCISARMQVPAIMVLDRNEQINAMAAGWGPRDSAVIATTEALTQLNRDELQGMMAHELSHIREGDTRLNMQLAAMVYGLQMIFGYGRALNHQDVVFLRVFGGLIMYAGLLGWIAGCVLQAAIARQREYLADARAVEWTRQTAGLAGALQKIDEQQLPSRSRRHILEDLELSGHRMESGAVEHMWLAPPLEASVLGGWLDSHPPIEERLRRLHQKIVF